MILSKTVIIYVLVLSVQGFLSSRKKSYWGFILPTIASILFLAGIDDSLYELLLWQTVILGVARIAVTITHAIKFRKTRQKTDKMKIKDL